MRKLLIFGVPALLAAQSTTTTYTTDVNGNRQAMAPSSRSNGDESTRYRTPSGGRATMDQSDEKVLREDANGKVVEKTIKRYDGTGKVSQTIKVLVEETKFAGGGSVVRETSSQADLNGRFVQTERKTTETRVSGQTTTSNVTLDQPNINGGYQTVEKRNSVTTGPETNQTTTETVDRADTYGRMRLVERSETSKKATPNGSAENTANYEVDATGKLVLAGQKIVTTTKRPGGGEAVETSLYERNTSGRAAGDQLRIKEQQVVEKRVNPDGTVVETLTVRRPTISDPNTLGPARQISETVCTGKCVPAAAPATAPAKPDQSKAPAPTATAPAKGK